MLYEALDVVDQDDRELLGVGVSVAGLVDASSGTIKYAPSLGWRDVAAQAGVTEALGGRAPVLLDNNANFAALAERRHRRRNGRRPRSLVYLTGTYGISAGIITGGALWRGERGLAGEVGHLIVEADGQRVRVRAARLLRHPRRTLGDRRLLRWSGASDPAPRRARPRRGDQRGQSTRSPRWRRAATRASIEALAEAGTWLGRGAALVCAILDPRTVVLGGHYARLAPWMLAPAREAFRRCAADAGARARAAGGLGTRRLGPGRGRGPRRLARPDRRHPAAALTRPSERPCAWRRLVAT